MVLQECHRIKLNNNQLSRRGVGHSSDGEQDHTFELFKSYLDKKLDSLKRDLAEEGDSLSEQTIKR